MGNKAQSIQNISQNRTEYISVYDLVEWAKVAYQHNYYFTADDLIRLLQNRDITLYHQFTGIKPSIEKSDINLLQALSFIKENNGYEEVVIDNFDDDIPF